MCICGALQSSTVYLCAGGRRWQCLGGRRHGKLPGWARQRGQLDDIFLMKFDAQGVHLWTHQRGGGSDDYARALEADGVRLRFRICSMEEKHGKTLDPLARSMF